MRFVKIPAIMSTVPDLSSVVLHKLHRENRKEYFLSNLPVFWVDHYISVCLFCDNRMKVCVNSSKLTSLKELS